MNEITSTGKKTPLLFSVVLDGSLKTRISGFQTKGQGGFQDLLKMLKENLKEEILSLPLSKWVRLWNYTQKYGSGGYQSILKKLVQLFKNQHTAIDLSKAECGIPRKKRTTKPRQLSFNEVATDQERILDLLTGKR